MLLFVGAKRGWLATSPEMTCFAGLRKADGVHTLQGTFSLCHTNVISELAQKSKAEKNLCQGFLRGLTLSLLLGNPEVGADFRKTLPRRPRAGPMPVCFSGTRGDRNVQVRWVL